MKEAYIGLGGTSTGIRGGGGVCPTLRASSSAPGPCSHKNGEAPAGDAHGSPNALWRGAGGVAEAPWSRSPSPRACSSFGISGLGAMASAQLKPMLFMPQS
eukprot:362430-Chlamydomonas_euryale.AAC.8